MTAKGYCVYSDIESHLGRTFTAGQITWCGSLIERAEVFIDEETRRGWLVGAQTNEAHFGNEFWRSGFVFLRYAPVTSVASVVGRVSVGETEETLTVDEDYEILDLLNGQILLYTTGFDRIRVTYTPVASVPGDIKQACIEVVANWMQTSLNPGMYGLDSVSLPDYSVKFARTHVQMAVPPLAMDVLDRYRYPVIG